MKTPVPKSDVDFIVAFQMAVDDIKRIDEKMAKNRIEIENLTRQADILRKQNVSLLSAIKRTF